MPLLINLYNQIGAGPKNISLNLIRGLEKTTLSSNIYIIVPDYAEYAKLKSSNPNLNLFKYNRKTYTLSKVWFRLYLELWVIPQLMREFKIKQLLAFGNFLFSPGNFCKLVLCHHPYLYDNNLLSKLSLLSKIPEYFKRIAFRLTLWNVKHLVVQSQYVAEQLRTNWHLPDDLQIHVIPNPISNSFKKPGSSDLASMITQRSQRYRKSIKILYVSRFYPHKNHHFLISLSSALKKLDLAHEIQVTIDPSIESSKSFLHAIANNKLPIVNIGECEQEVMATIYQQADLFVFPSNAETFGNPIIEAMCYGLPLVLPDLGYAKAIASTAGNYYPVNDADACASIMLDLVNNEPHYVQRSLDSHDAFQHFPNVDQWITMYLNALNQAHSES